MNTFAIFIYHLGAVTFATAVAWMLFKAVDKLEGRR